MLKMGFFGEGEQNYFVEIVHLDSYFASFSDKKTFLFKSTLFMKDFKKGWRILIKICTS